MTENNETIERLADVYFDYEKDLDGYVLPDIEPTLENTSFYAEEGGWLYYYCGNTRIKVHEHFAERSKPMSAMLENLILYTARKTS